MNTFTASNGYKVTPNGDGANVYRGIMSTPIYPDEMQALREFFQAEGDERAGRWRYPDEPQYVVYYDQMRDRVTVFNENLMDEDGGCGISRGNTLDYPSVQHIAQAYFAAHPEPKPDWESRRVGEAWVLTIGGRERVFTVDQFLNFRTTNGVKLSFYSDADITAGYRIYPPQE